MLPRRLDTVERAACEKHNTLGNLRDIVLLDGTCVGEGNMLWRGISEDTADLRCTGMRFREDMMRLQQVPEKRYMSLDPPWPRSRRNPSHPMRDGCWSFRGRSGTIEPSDEHDPRRNWRRIDRTHKAWWRVAAAQVVFRGVHQ